MKSRKPQGDIDLEYQDILEFTQGFSKAHIEYFCFMLGIKALIGKQMNNGRLVRSVFRETKKVDDVLLLKVFPRLQKYCSEVVGKLEK